MLGVPDRKLIRVDDPLALVTGLLIKQVDPLSSSVQSVEVRKQLLQVVGLRQHELLLHGALDDLPV